MAAAIASQVESLGPGDQNCKEAIISEQTYLGGGFKKKYVHPYLGKIPILTNIFRMGWNHQPRYSGSSSRSFHCEDDLNESQFQFQFRTKNHHHESWHVYCEDLVVFFWTCGNAKFGRREAKISFGSAMEPPVDDGITPGIGTLDRRITDVESIPVCSWRVVKHPKDPDISEERDYIYNEKLWGDKKLGGGFKYFLFSPLFREDKPILTNIFQRGWNHQPEKLTSLGF